MQPLPAGVYSLGLRWLPTSEPKAAQNGIRSLARLRQSMEICLEALVGKGVRHDDFERDGMGPICRF